MTSIKHRAALPALALAAAALLPAFAPRDDEQGESAQAAVSAARTALEQWVETRRVISKERRDWALGGEILADRIEVMRQEIASFRELIAAAEEDIVESDEQREELFAENEELKASAARLAATVAALEARTAGLLKRLPEPIRERVKPLSQRFPEDPAATKLGLGERFQNVVGVLNEVNKFHGEITLASEVRELPDGSSVEVTSVYLGVSQGFYANAAGNVAGVGAAGPESWTWRAANEAAPQVAEVIAILQSEKPAAFVPLPVEIDAHTGDREEEVGS